MPFCHLQLRGGRPLPPACPKELKTLEDHLRKERLDLELRQWDVVAGTFTPTGDDAIPFGTYFEVEIEVELEFTTPLVVTEERSESFVVELSPSLWFLRADVTVWDLSELDYTTMQMLIEFHLEIEDGFDLEIET